MKLQSLAVEIMKSARAGETSLDLWKGYCEKIKNVVDNLNHTSICSIIHSFGHMRYKHTQLLSVLSTNLYKSVPFLTTKQITSVLKSFSLLNFKNEFMMQILSKHAAKLAPMMNPYELSTLLYSYASLNSCNLYVFYPIKCSVSDKIDKFGPKELSLLLGGLCKINCDDLQLITVVSSHFCKTISSNDPKSLSLSSNYLLRLKLGNSKIVAMFIAREIMRYKPKFSSQGLSLILNSISKYNDDISLFQRYSMIIQLRIDEFNIHSCCLVASAVSRANYKEIKLLEVLAERVGKQSNELYPQAVATLAYSFAKLNHLHGPLMYYSGKHLVSYLEDYTLDQICMIIKSYFILHIDDKEVLEFVIISLKHNWCLDKSGHKFAIKNSTTCGLLWIMECYAAFLIVNEVNNL